VLFVCNNGVCLFFCLHRGVDSALCLGLLLEFLSQDVCSRPVLLYFELSTWRSCKTFALEKRATRDLRWLRGSNFLQPGSVRPCALHITSKCQLFFLIVSKPNTNLDEICPAQVKSLEKGNHRLSSDSSVFAVPIQLYGHSFAHNCALGLGIFLNTFSVLQLFRESSYLFIILARQP